MKEIPSAFMWASGQVQITSAATLPEGALPLMTGPDGKLEMILDGNAERLVTADGSMAWAVETVVVATTSSERYVAAMLWLAKIAKLYPDERVVFHVNRAANRDVRRVTARVINTKLN